MLLQSSRFLFSFLIHRIFCRDCGISPAQRNNFGYILKLFIIKQFLKYTIYMVFNLSHDYQYMYMLLPTLLKGYKVKSNSPIVI